METQETPTSGPVTNLIAAIFEYAVGGGFLYGAYLLFMMNNYYFKSVAVYLGVRVISHAFTSAREKFTVINVEEKNRPIFGN